MKPKFNIKYFERAISQCFTPEEESTKNKMLTVLSLKMKHDEYITWDEMFNRLKRTV